MAQIKIKTLSSTIEFESEIDFNPIELPYMCLQGYRNNCTSSASIIDLNKYWDLIDDFFASNKIETQEYVTLETIIHNGERFGV